MADVGMDSINIEIESSSDKAVEGIVTLEKALTSLNSKLSGIQNTAAKYTKNFQNIGNTLKNIKMPKLPKMSEMFNGKQPEQNPLKKIQQSNNKKDDDNDNSSKKSKKNLSSVNNELQKLMNLTEMAGNRIKRMLSYLGKVVVAKVALKGLNSAFGNIGGKVSTLSGNLKALAKNLSKYALALYGIRSAFYAVRNTTNEFLSSQDAVAKQLSTNISYLKFAIGSMFTPVIEYITNLIYKLLQAIQALVYFFAKINIFAGKTASNYASMANSGSKAAKEAQKQLQAFDELNNINLDKNNGSGAGTITPSFDLSGIREDLLPKFDDIENIFRDLAKKINSILASIKWESIIEKTTSATKKIAKALNAFTDELDFGLLGYTIAQGFNTVFANLNTFFDTYNFEKLGTKLGQGLNSIVVNLNWESLGKTLTNGFKAAINTLYGIVTTFSFMTLGDSIAKAINAAFANINWINVGQVLYRGVTGILDTFIRAFSNINFEEIGQNIGKALAQIKWDEVFKKVATAIIKAFSGIGNIFKGIFEEVKFEDFTKGVVAGVNELTSKVKETIEKMDFKKAGESLATNLNILLRDTNWADIGKTIGEGLIKALEFAVGFLKTFDFSSIGKAIADLLMNINWAEVAINIGKILTQIMQNPGKIIWGLLSELFKELPGKIWEFIQNIPQMLADFFGGLGEFIEPYFKESFLGTLINVFSPIADILGGFFQGALDVIQFIWNGAIGFFQGIIDGIFAVFSVVGDVLGAFFQGALIAIQFIWNGVIGFFQGIWDTISSIFSAAPKVLGDFFQGAWDTIKGIWDGAVGFFQGVWDGITVVFSVTGKVLGDFFQGAWNIIKGVWDGVTGFFSGVWEGIKSVFGSVANWFRDVFSAAWQAVKNVFSAGGRIFEGIKEGIANVLKAVINAIIRGINFVIAIPFNAINGILRTLRGIDILGIRPFSWIQTFGVPQIPTFAKGGYPTEGQLFIANEGGIPEMVGNIGNKTAVANNDQITKAIADATYSAFVQALNDSSGNEGQPLNIYIGNDKVYKGYTKQQSQMSNQYGVVI